MNGIKSMNSIGIIRSSKFFRALWIALTINFINLSVNFTEQHKELDDPVDTISEMIFEWGLDGADDTIPDNSAEEENQNIKKFVFIGRSALLLNFSPYLTYFISNQHYRQRFLPSVFILLGTPPPDQN